MQDNKLIGETDIQQIVEIPQYGKKNIILDSQILTALMTCPRLSDLRFNHNLVSINGKSNSMECGSIVHVFAEYYYGNIIKGLDKEKAKGFGFAAAETYIRGCPDCTGFIPFEKNENGVFVPVTKPICGHKPNEFPGVRNTPKDSTTTPSRTGWQWVLDTLDQYCIYYRNDHWVSLEVETVKGEILYEDDEIRILWKAKIDWIVDTNQGIYPADHKTMKQRRDTLSLNNQFIGYCLIMKTRNIMINKIGFQASLKPDEKFIRAPISYSASRLFEWQSEILPYYAKLLLMYAETGYFPPNFNACEGKYGHCAFVNVCQADPAMREEEIKHEFVVGPEWNPQNEED